MGVDVNEAPGGAGPGRALSRDRALHAAVSLADAEGFDAVTMRRLGRELGAGAMSIYHYVKNKDDLLDGMIDLVFAEIAAPEAGGDWREAMLRRSVSARDVLRKHAWAVSLMESRARPGAANLEHREAVTACLREAGFTIEMTAHATWLLDSYVYGFVLQEVALPFDGPDELADSADAFMALLPPERYPYSHETARTLLDAGYDPGSEFAFGLNVILDALERLRSRS